MEGIIYRIADYKESSKILTILTPNGVETLIAKGCKKINSNLLSVCQTYNRISYVRTDKNIYTLVEGSIIDSIDVKFDIEKNKTLSLIFRHISLINEFNDLFYMFILKTIEALKVYDAKSVYMMFKIKLLFFLGIKPQFTCKCGRKNNLIDFDMYNGVSLCMKCANKNIAETVTLIRTIYYNKSFNTILSESEYKLVYDFISEYFYIHLNLKIAGENNS